MDFTSAVDNWLGAKVEFSIADGDEKQDTITVGGKIQGQVLFVFEDEAVLIEHVQGRVLLNLARVTKIKLLRRGSSGFSYGGPKTLIELLKGFEKATILIRMGGADSQRLEGPLHAVLEDSLISHVPKGLALGAEKENTFLSWPWVIWILEPAKQTVGPRKAVREERDRPDDDPGTAGRLAPLMPKSPAPSVHEELEVPVER